MKAVFARWRGPYLQPFGIAGVDEAVSNELDGFGWVEGRGIDDSFVCGKEGVLKKKDDFVNNSAFLQMQSMHSLLAGIQT